MPSDRLYRLNALIQSRPGISLQDIMSELEVSRATAKRDIEALRDRFDTPIVYDRDIGGYLLDPSQLGQGTQVAQLPGLWFSPEEAYALLTAQQLLSSLEPGLLGPRLKPLMDKLNKLLASAGQSAEAVQSRVKVSPAGKRRLKLDAFQVIASATLQQNRLRFSHYNRQNGERSERYVSPQRLVHYRDNWYLDAWCHQREALRSFSVDAISDCRRLDEPALRVPETELQASMESSYGIFRGSPKAWARMRFSPHRARWVSREVWHAQQRSYIEPDGSFVLEVPYADERELVGDILRFGADVEVLQPPQLRRMVQAAVMKAVERYLG
ncbi:MAG TPA: YafY family protein [Hydrogenophaga sp.]|uniref:helix-turn-helix transcriptional regulator n=1 Tax=Hydrogenophaga sp. TaxID=1904254 RepID=UPI002CAB0317|nr:YafY family protein [Hydrogenophaga sp.]HMN92723.1 YafY family protein [Hydrogenophaga sp.]HMP08881.1 YafY family protein [Hydrogenophaga sp.]